MKRIIMADTTLCREEGVFSFKDKMEIARQLERLKVDIIELPPITRPHADTLLVRTMASFVKNATVSVAAGQTMESIDLAAAALEGMAHPRIRIELPLSPVGMEYTCHKKPQKMLEWITTAVAAACQRGCEVEFCAVDATRADETYLKEAIRAAIAAGAGFVAVCDSAGTRLPDDFATFIADLKQEIAVPLSVRCDDQNGLGCAQAILAVRQGAACVKTSIGGAAVPLELFVGMVKNCGDTYGFATGIRTTELHRVVRQIAWITDKANTEKVTTAEAGDTEDTVHLDAKDDQAAVMAAVARLGYDLSEEDQARVYEEFCRVAEKKTVGAKELEAIVASTAMQVPATYRLVSFVMNNGNIISASAQITLKKDGKELQGVSIGDGPIDAAFLAIGQIVGHRYELDDFQIQSVTQGTEAVGSALVKLRTGGKLYSGNGISTDIMEAGILAYLNAINKIVYEEA